MTNNHQDVRDYMVKAGFRDTGSGKNSSYWIKDKYTIQLYSNLDDTMNCVVCISGARIWYVEEETESALMRLLDLFEF